MLNKLISNEQNSCKSVMQSFSPLRITCSVITLGLCLTTASVGVNTAYALPVHNPARQQGVHMQSQTNLRYTSITQELPFVVPTNTRTQKHLDTSRTDSANSFEHTLAHMPSSPVSTDDKSVSKPSGKHFASSDANTVQVNTKSVERKNGRQGSIQNVGSKDSKDSKSIQDSKLTQDVRAQNQMLFADRSAQAPYDVPFNLQYKSFSSEMTYFQKWESGRNYNHGFGAGDSYNALGAYQFDRRYGLDTFMKQVYNYDPQTFYMLSEVGEKYNWDFSTYDVFDKASGTFTQFGDDLNQAWHSAYAASPDVFSRLQDYYAYYNYYAAPDGVKRSLSYFGVDPDERSDSFKSLVWGMANLFGKGGGIYSLRAGNYWGCNKFFKLANIDGSMNDAQLIAAICDAVIDNVKNIYPSQQIYWQGWINRYTDEKAHYLSLSIGSWQLDSHGWYYVDSTGRIVKGWFNAVNGKRWYADPSTGYAIFGDCVVRGYHYWIDSGYGLLYNSWIDNQDGTRMRTDGLGRLIKGWYKDSSGSCFYFDSNFKMTLGKVSVEGKDYWLDKDRGLLYNEWVKDESGKWLHTDGNGCLLTGWYHAPNGKWFYFNKDSYQMVTGKLTDDNKDYWLDENAGLLYDRWVQDSQGNWLHTDGNGCLLTGWYHAPNGKWFYFNKDSYQMVTGKLTDDNKDYWLDENAGLLYDRWVQDSQGNWLHTDDNGVLATGWFKTKSGYWFYFNQDHTMKTGILTDKGYTFWLDKNDGLLYNQWVKDGSGKWLRTDGNGCLLTGWYHAPNGKWFYFNKDTYQMVTGKLTDDHKDYWLDENAGLLYDRWVQDNQGNWLHTDDNGCLLTGWYHAPNGKWFYFNKDNYKMVTGKLTDDHKDYWLDENAGLLYDRWVQDGKGNWLHTDDNGVLATGWFKTKSGYWFYFNQDHTMKTGILTDKGYTFWLDKNDGLLYNEWVKDSKGNWLRTDGNGCLLKGWYHAPNGKWFYFNKDNYQMVTGKLTDDHKDYWLDENAGLLYDAWVQDNQGNWLHTDDNGVLVTGWFKTKSGYWFYFNQDHTMKTGILTDKGYTFWLDKNDGLLYNQWVKDGSGKWLRTDGNGCLLTGWYHAPNGKWFYFNKDTYQMVTGKLTDDNKDYWLDENAGLLYDSWIYTDDGSWLFADQNAYLVKGWYHTSPTKLFYFDPLTHKALFGHITVNGEHFYVDENQGLDLDLSDTPSAETLKRWLLKTAAGEIGYEALKDPEAGSKYGRWMAEKTDTPWLRGPSTRVWWCAIFVSWCFDQAHIDWDVLPSYNCDQIYSRALNDGKSQILSDVHDCKPGDIVLYNFLGGTGFQHIGIIESNNGSTITTIEGNTSSGEAGSQHAGNGVWRRTRPFTHVRAIIRPYPFV